MADDTELEPAQERLSVKRLEDMATWENHVKKPTVRQMVVGLLLAERRTMARELLRFREGYPFADFPFSKWR